MLVLIYENSKRIEFSYLDELAQDSEDEFSPTSGKKKNQNGKYSIDVDWRVSHLG
ncbi:hypothetical protein PHSC3_000069 [Chlamydiales bacterium STE3]|nr:hypothetical protein PHSC3_000069 [Chlamydiales bacterium STE3]